jgi:hypothetical protein
MGKMEALLGRRLRPLPVGRPRKKKPVASPRRVEKGKAKGKRTRKR